MKLLVGEVIRLDLQLFDGATNKFVRAFLNDELGNPITPAFVDLIHFNNGLYKNFSLTFPNRPEVTATFKVFDDSAFTLESLDHGEALDVFQLDTLANNQPILDKIAELLNVVTSHDLNSQLIGLLDPLDVLTGVVQPLDAIGFVENNITLTGFVLDRNDISGNIFDDTGLAGTIV